MNVEEIPAALLSIGARLVVGVNPHEGECIADELNECAAALVDDNAARALHSIMKGAGFHRVESAPPVPPFVKTALDEWATAGQWPGQFVTAVLQNDLIDAFGKADPNSLAAMLKIVGYVYNDLPARCHGSKERMNQWAARFDR